MPPSNLTVDERDSAPSAEEFLQQYVEPNKPLIIRGGAKTWPAMKWSAGGLSGSVWQRDCHRRSIAFERPARAPRQVARSRVALGARRARAGCVRREPFARRLSDARQDAVKKFVRLLRDESVAAGFYADGAGNLAHSFPFLRDGFSEPQFAAESPLELKKADLWMGGKSISRMHFDNLDNLFAQVVGRKTFVLARPHEGAKVQGGKRLRKAACRYAHPGRVLARGRRRAPRDGPQLPRRAPSGPTRCRRSR